MWGHLFSGREEELGVSEIKNQKCSCKAYPQVGGGTGEGKKVPPWPKRKDKKK